MQSLPLAIDRKTSWAGTFKLKIIYNFAFALPYSMIAVNRQIVRLALFVMLFQFICPAFLPIVTQRDAVSKETSVSQQHTSIVIPLLLKEKDEKENAEFTSNSDPAPLLDLSSHSINLTAAHDIKHAEVYEEHGLTRPPLFQMLCTLVI